MAFRNHLRQSPALPRVGSSPSSSRSRGLCGRYLTLGVGKYFHDVNKALGFGSNISYPAGTGLPPQADPPSWSNISIQNVNFSALEGQIGRFGNVYEGCAYTGGTGFGYISSMDGCWGPNHTQHCSIDAPRDGTGASPPFCDTVAYTQAIKHLRYAKQNRESTGQPFFVVTGIRRPHLTWRVPAAYTAMYDPEGVALPTQTVLDPSIDPIAWTAFAGLGGDSPFNYTNTDAQVKTYRAAYYAAVSWGDFVAGKVLDELDALGLTDSTAVVLHSDHGWHLGEYNMWEKRTLWENAARVPLIIRAPWIQGTPGERGGVSGQQTNALVELVDIYKTVCELAEIGLPEEDTHSVEGTSLVGLLEDPTGRTWSKNTALSTYANPSLYASKHNPGLLLCL